MAPPSYGKTFSRARIPSCSGNLHGCDPFHGGIRVHTMAEAFDFQPRQHPLGYPSVLPLVVGPSSVGSMIYPVTRVLGMNPGGDKSAREQGGILFRRAITLARAASVRMNTGYGTLRPVMFGNQTPMRRSLMSGRSRPLIVFSRSHEVPQGYPACNHQVRVPCPRPVDMLDSTRNMLTQA